MIEFLAANEDILKDSPIIPASRYLPHVLKDVPLSTSEQTTVKNCPGIIKYASAGYLLCAHTDIILTARNDVIGGFVDFTFDDPEEKGFAFNLFYPQHKANFYFDPEMFEKYFNRPEMFPQTYAWTSPWAVRTPENMGVYFLPVYYGGENVLEAIPGVLDSYYVPRITPMFRVKRFYGSVIIPRGTPLLRLLPFKKETFDFTMGVVNDKDMQHLSISADLRQDGCPYKTQYKLFKQEIEKLNEDK